MEAPVPPPVGGCENRRPQADDLTACGHSDGPSGAGARGCGVTQWSGPNEVGTPVPPRSGGGETNPPVRTRDGPTHAWRVPTAPESPACLERRPIGIGRGTRRSSGDCRGLRGFQADPGGGGLPEQRPVAADARRRERRVGAGSQDARGGGRRPPHGHCPRGGCERRDVRRVGRRGGLAPASRTIGKTPTTPRTSPGAAASSTSRSTCEPPVTPTRAMPPGRTSQTRGTRTAGGRRSTTWPSSDPGPNRDSETR